MLQRLDDSGSEISGGLTGQTICLYGTSGSKVELRITGHFVLRHCSTPEQTGTDDGVAMQLVRQWGHALNPDDRAEMQSSRIKQGYLGS